MWSCIVVPIIGGFTFLVYCFGEKGGATGDGTEAERSGEIEKKKWEGANEAETVDRDRDRDRERQTRETEREK